MKGNRRTSKNLPILLLVTLLAVGSFLGGGEARAQVTETTISATGSCENSRPVVSVSWEVSSSEWHRYRVMKEPNITISPDKPTLGGNTGSYTDSDVTGGNSYYYYIEAALDTDAGWTRAADARAVVPTCASTITVSNNTNGGWTINPGNLTGTGNGSVTVTPGSYTITGANVDGYNYPPAITNSKTGVGSSLTIFAGENGAFDLKYEKQVSLVTATLQVPAEFRRYTDFTYSWDSSTGVAVCELTAPTQKNLTPNGSITVQNVQSIQHNPSDGPGISDRYNAPDYPRAAETTYALKCYQNADKTGASATDTKVVKVVYAKVYVENVLMNASTGGESDTAANWSISPTGYLGQCGGNSYNNGSNPCVIDPNETGWEFAGDYRLNYEIKKQYDIKIEKTVCDEKVAGGCQSRVTLHYIPANSASYPIVYFNPNNLERITFRITYVDNGTPICPAGQVWNGTSCTDDKCVPDGTTKCPCPANQVWNGTKCVDGPCVVGDSKCCPTGQVWDGSKCVNDPECIPSTPNTPKCPKNCPAGSSATINITTDIPASWTINPGGITKTGNATASVVPATSGTVYSITGANVSGYPYPPSYTNSKTGAGSSMLVLPCDNNAGFSLTYTPVASFDYTLSTSGNVVVRRGSGTPGQTTITKTLISGNTEAVDLSISGVPSGVAATFNTSKTCSPTCQSPILFSASSGAPLGTYVITVTGTPLGKIVKFSLTVGENDGSGCTGSNCPGDDDPLCPGPNCGSDNSLRVTCSASPALVTVGKPVTWTATPSESGNWRYLWSGTNIPKSPAPTSNPYVITYSTVGVKEAYVFIYDETRSATCRVATVRVTVNPEFEEF